jgi:hypothetical protein
VRLSFGAVGYDAFDNEVLSAAFRARGAARWRGMGFTVGSDNY